jgi:hypothetical protein
MLVALSTASNIMSLMCLMEILVGRFVLMLTETFYMCLYKISPVLHNFLFFICIIAHGVVY